VIRLWPDDEVTLGLTIGEGVETVLAAATRIQHRGTLLQPAWACGGAGNLSAFRVITGIESLTILVDRDESGGGQDAAAVCASRWLDAEREVIRLKVRFPPF
jgi:Toprim domain